jgi:hypothetical protein
MAHKRELAMRSTHSRIHIHIFLRAGSVVVVVKKVAKLPKARKKKGRCGYAVWKPSELRSAVLGRLDVQQGPSVKRRFWYCVSDGSLQYIVTTVLLLQLSSPAEYFN